MLDYIYRLVSGFEREHGVHPNLLYLNPVQSEYLRLSFDEKFTLAQIMQMLNMDLVIAPETMHPHVAWTQAAHRVAS